MNTSEWVEAASEVLSYTSEPTVAVAVNELLRKFGAKAIVEALENAASEALDHCGEGNGTCDEPADRETVRKLDEVRGHLRMAGEWLEERDASVGGAK